MTLNLNQVVTFNISVNHFMVMTHYDQELIILERTTSNSVVVIAQNIFTAWCIEKTSVFIQAIVHACCTRAV